MLSRGSTNSFTRDLNDGFVLSTYKFSPFLQFHLSLFHTSTSSFLRTTLQFTFFSAKPSNLNTKFHLLNCHVFCHSFHGNSTSCTKQYDLILTSSLSSSTVPAHVSAMDHPRKISPRSVTLDLP